PAWSGHPYFKASSDDFKRSDFVQQNRMWNTSPGSMERMLHEREAWKKWFDETSMLALEAEGRSGAGAARPVSVPNKADVVASPPGPVAPPEATRSALWAAPR